MFELFVSTYPNITNPFSDLAGDRALDLYGASSTCIVDASSLEEAIDQFCLSETFKTFREKHTGRVYIYIWLDATSVKRVD
ncbi:MAG: hypothetical protein IJP64_05510 [Oscillospiraceae bacterium]|nr:hypothetical protein [Oscillospiraceae bacterium]